MVLLGSEGEAENVAPTFDAFLLALARGDTGVSPLDDEDAAASRPALGRWLAKQGCADAKATRKVPDFARWLAGEDEPEHPTGAATEFAMADFTATLFRLLGKTTQDAELREFVAALGHWPLPHFRSENFALYVEDKPRGFCLLFDEAPKVPGVKGQVLVLDSCFFYSEGKDGYRGFASAMPRGITWADTVETLLPRLGKPAIEIHNKKTGALSSQRWAGDPNRPYGKGAPYVAAGYRKDGRLDDVFLGML